MIQTERLFLPPMSERFLEASLDADVEAAEAEIGLTIPEEWFARKGFIGLRLAQLRQDETFRPFSPRAIALTSAGEMVGDINFHTPPDPAYLREMGVSGIELGYTVFGRYRRRGYVQEALLGLIRWAHEARGVEIFVVSVSPRNAPSVRLAYKLGFMKVAEQLDPEDGPEEVYVLEGEPLQAALALQAPTAELIKLFGAANKTNQGNGSISNEVKTVADEQTVKVDQLRVVGSEEQ